MGANNEREFDMFDYIGEGRTMYDFIDAHLDGFLNGDFSLSSLVKHLRSFGNHIMRSMFKEQTKKRYQEIFSILANKFVLALNPTSDKFNDVRMLSEDEKQVLLKRLQDLNPRIKFNSIEEYIKLAQENNSNEPYYNELDDIIIDAAIDVLSDEDKVKMKYTLWNQLYVPEVGNKLKALYSSRYKIQYPEWEEYEFIRRTLYDQSKFRKYDRFIEAYKEDMAKKSTDTALSMSCKAKRERYVIQEMVEAMTPEEQDKVMEKKMIESVVFEKPDNMKIKEGSHVWQIIPHPVPEIILDRTAEYSPNGIENQRVIAISYGKFEYGTLIKRNGEPTFVSDELELVGITRIGKDGTQNYFVLMPTKDVLIKKHDVIDVTASKVESKGRVKYSIEDMYLGNPVVYLERTSKISEELADFYAKVALSDNYLTAAMYGNYRYAGRVQTVGNKPSLNATYAANTYDFEAVYYASKYPGRTPNGQELTLDAYCKSAEFLAMHFDILNQLPENKVWLQNPSNREILQRKTNRNEFDDTPQKDFNKLQLAGKRKEADGGYRDA